MIITEEIIADKFEEYNKTYFNYELPTPRFGLLKSYRTCGYFSCKKEKGKRRVKQQQIDISVYYDWDEKDLRDIIVHEMVHYYLRYNHIDDNVSHGEAFHAMAKEMNEKYGLNITERVNTLNFKRAPNAPKISWFFAHYFG